MIARCRILPLFSIVVLFVFVGVSFSGEGKTIELFVGESTVRGCGGDTWLVSIGNPAIADVELKKAGQRRYVLVEAKAQGVTNVVVCKGDDCTEAFKLVVWNTEVEIIRGSDVSMQSL